MVIEPTTTTPKGGAPLVSVVIPCYNYGRFLGEAIESALNQTHQPIEVIVVDDGSSDDSRDVAARYPLQLIAQQNKGVCAAVNAGVQASHGEFVLRLDADDCLMPTYVEETLRALREHPEASFAYTEVEYFGATSGSYPIEPFDPETLAERNYVNASALMHRSAFDQVGGYSEHMHRVRFDDWDLWLKFVERGLRGVMVPGRLLRYRQHHVASRVTIDFRSLRGLTREIRMAGMLQDNHPGVFTRSLIFRRLRLIPGRIARREISLRYATLLTGLYGVMIWRTAFRSA